MEILYTPKEVAKELRISYGHVLKLVKEGKLRAKKVGNRKMLVPESALTTFINAK